MGYWDDDYYDREPSEVDIILEEARDKLYALITSGVHNEIVEVQDSAKKWEKKYNDCKDENRKFFSTITDQDRQIRELKEELDKKRTELGILPFEVNEYVYCIVTDYENAQTITCPRCNGKGKVAITHNGMEYTRTCPNCNDSIYSKGPHRESSYHPYKLKKGVINYISQVIVPNEKTKEPEIETVYKVNSIQVPVEYIRKVPSISNSLTDESIKKELQEIINSLNKKLRHKAYAEVGRDIPNDEL